MSIIGDNIFSAIGVSIHPTPFIWNLEDVASFEPSLKHAFDLIYYSSSKIRMIVKVRVEFG